MPLWQWLAILIAFPIAIALGWLLVLLPRIAVRYYRKQRDPGYVPKHSLYHVGPGTLLLSAILHYIFVFIIGASIVPASITGASSGFFWHLRLIGS